MPYCSSCGSSVGDQAAFCTKCGKPIAPTLHRARVSGRKNTGAKMILLVFGGIVIAAGIIGCIIGGVLLNAGRDGFVIRPAPLQSDAYAVVMKDISIDVDDMSGSWGRMEWSPEDFVTLALTGRSNDESREFFAAIARRADAAEYLDDVKYDEVIKWDWQATPFKGRFFDYEYRRHSGGRKPEDPSGKAFWIESTMGSGEQSLEWELETGDYWIVVMNGDASPGIDSTLEFRIKMPGLFRVIGWLILVGSIVALVIGGLIVYFGTRAKL